jgi:hypothetical protein
MSRMFTCLKDLLLYLEEKMIIAIDYISLSTLIFFNINKLCS